MLYYSQGKGDTDEKVKAKDLQVSKKQKLPETKGLTPQS